MRFVYHEIYKFFNICKETRGLADKRAIHLSTHTYTQCSWHVHRPGIVQWGTYRYCHIVANPYHQILQRGEISSQTLRPQSQPFRPSKKQTNRQDQTNMCMCIDISKQNQKKKPQHKIKPDPLLSCPQPPIPFHLPDTDPTLSLVRRRRPTLPPIHTPHPRHPTQPLTRPRLRPASILTRRAVGLAIAPRTRCRGAAFRHVGWAGRVDVFAVYVLRLGHECAPPVAAAGVALFETEEFEFGVD